MLLLIPVPLWQVLYCQLEKGKQPQALFTDGFSCYVGVTILGKWRCTIPLMSERNRGICKLLSIFSIKCLCWKSRKKKKENNPHVSKCSVTFTRDLWLVTERLNAVRRLENIEGDRREESI